MDKNRTIFFKNKPNVLSFASIAGNMEGSGPLKQYFDYIMPNALWEENSWEKAERKMYKYVISKAAEKANINVDKIDVLIGGDLLNQIITSSFAARDLGICFLGQYGACSTMAQSLLVGSMMIDGGFYEKVACCASSHFATAERQYRFPLEFGCQRPPTAQRTVTGAGCTILSNEKSHIYIKRATVGKIIDWGVEDPNNMGAVMAPAAANTIACHLKNTNQTINDLDLIVTGDLGTHGKDLCEYILKNDYNLDFGKKYIDCGCMIYEKGMDVDCGGSGCGCSACVLNGYLYDKLINREVKNILFLSTGALLSPTTSCQKDTIPGIAHAVEITREDRI